MRSCRHFYTGEQAPGWVCRSLLLVSCAGFFGCAELQADLAFNPKGEKEKGSEKRDEGT